MDINVAGAIATIIGLSIMLVGVAVLFLGLITMLCSTGSTGAFLFFSGLVAALGGSVLLELRS